MLSSITRVAPVGTAPAGIRSAPKRASSSLVVLTISLPQQFAVLVRTANPASSPATPEAESCEGPDGRHPTDRESPG